MGDLVPQRFGDDAPQMLAVAGHALVGHAVDGDAIGQREAVADAPFGEGPTLIQSQQTRLGRMIFHHQHHVAHAGAIDRGYAGQGIFHQLLECR